MEILIEMSFMFIEMNDTANWLEYFVEKDEFEEKKERLSTGKRECVEKMYNLVGNHKE